MSIKGKRKRSSQNLHPTATATHPRPPPRLQRRQQHNNRRWQRENHRRGQIQPPIHQPKRDEQTRRAPSTSPRRQSISRRCCGHQQTIDYVID